jgi:hypothetical protein
MPITAEERTLRSLRMKESWQKKKAQTGEAPADPALREAMAKVPMNGPVETHTNVVSLHVTGPIRDQLIEPSKILVLVDWEHVAMSEGQQFYAHLKSEFEKAGRILNARSMERTSGYTCFMCKKHFDGNPGFTDHSYVDPKTGLSPRVDCCGELCVINYNAMRINERHQRSIAQAQQERNG